MGTGEHSGGVIEEIKRGVDLALIGQVAEGHLSDKAIRVILKEEADPERTLAPRLTISILNVLENIASGSLPLRQADKTFFVPKTQLVHRLLQEVATKEEFADKTNSLRRNIDLVRKAAQLMLNSSPHSSDQDSE